MKKVEKVTFYVAVRLFDMKVHSNSTPKKFYRSGSLVGLGQRSLVSCLSTFSREFSSETYRPIAIKLHIQPPGNRGKKICRLCPDHMTKMAAMPRTRTILQNH